MVVINLELVLLDPNSPNRLRIGQSRFTHRHLLLGENAPECPSCKVPYSICHILIDCPVFGHHRITFLRTSVLTLSDLVGEPPH
ncbi:RNase H domain-containing protein [Trichonephila clavipes]|nr:RNase H domain-containing protein [Trichonephila clavipes]